MSDIQLNSIEEVIEDIKDGKFVIVVDNEDADNEGTLISAASIITPEKISFMENYAKGLICVSLSPERCDELDLPMMVTSNTSIHSTPFTVSIDLLGDSYTSGISANDRSRTIKALTKLETRPEDFARPGHVFPLRAKEKGVLSRIGHTEAAYDLVKLADLYPAGVLVEVKNQNGEMAKLRDLIEFGKKNKIKIATIESLIKYRLERESLIIRGAEVKMPTEYGDFHLIPFKQKSNGLEHIALIKGIWERDEAILVRMHSSCATGDIFGSKRCECGEQLHKSMKMIQKEGKGVIVYLNQEGRGIGLMAKMEAYKLQEEGYDTVDANVHLGYKADERDYGVGAAILREINVKKMRLLTNNPIKRIGLESFGLDVIENVAIEVGVNEYNKFYMQTKKERMGHDLNEI